MSDPTLGINTVKPELVPSSQPAPTSDQTPKIYNLDEPIITLPGGISLRRHRHSDAVAMSKHASNHKISRNMTNRWPTPYTVDKAHDWIAMCRQEDRWKAVGPTDPKSNNTAGLGQKLPVSWVIAHDDELIGSIGPAFQQDIRSRTLEFGYWIGEEYWGKGIMSMVLPAFVQWIWDTYPWIVKLEPRAFGWNPGSNRLLTKCGFELEGTLKCTFERMGVMGDLNCYGMVRPGIISSTEPPPEPPAQSLK